MQAKLSVFAILLGGAALALAAMNQTKDVPAPRSDSRIRDLTAKVDDLTRRVQRLSVRRAREGGGGMAPDAATGSRDTIPAESGDERATAGTVDDKRINEIVDAAVDKKTREVVDKLKIKENKKPKFDVLASTLGLNNDQRYAAQQELIKQQTEATRILATPTQNGRNLMDDLIDAMAKTQLWPGKDHGFGEWIGRLMTEKVPGTDETYAAQLEAIKKATNTALGKTFNKAQAKEYTEWGVNPLEIEGLGGENEETWNKAFANRLKQLQAQYPNGLPK